MAKFALPEPFIDKIYYWDAPDYGPECRTVDGSRALVAKITITFLPDGETTADVRGVVVTANGIRDRRFGYEHLCWVDSLPTDVKLALAKVVADNPYRQLGITSSAVVEKRETHSYDEFVVAVYSHRPVDWRLGQHAFNLLREWRRDLADEVVRAGDLDPFYDDGKLTVFLNWCAEHWDEP